MNGRKIDTFVDLQKGLSQNRGDNIVLVVFGAGLTWAAAAIRW